MRRHAESFALAKLTKLFLTNLLTFVYFQLNGYRFHTEDFVVVVLTRMYAQLLRKINVGVVIETEI
jgi:hypothetical protein